MATRSKSAGHYATNTRQKLAERHKQTREVKDILSGEGYKKIKPQYVSKPDIKQAEVCFQHLNEPDRFADHRILYGKKQNLRHLDPDMSVVLAWGENDPPVKRDFISNKNAFTENTKINKMGVNFISEKQDKFRDPNANEKKTKEDQLLEYLQHENQTVIRQKIYHNLLEKDEMENFTTEYRTQMTKSCPKNDKSQSLHKHYNSVTVAGKPSYMTIDKPITGIVQPKEFFDEQMNERLTIENTWKKVGWIHVNQHPTLRREVAIDDEDATEEERALALKKLETTVNDQQK